MVVLSNYVCTCVAAYRLLVVSGICVTGFAKRGLIHAITNI